DTHCVVPRVAGGGARHLVGVDVVGLAAGVGADRGDHGDQVLGQQAVDEGRVDVGDVAHETQLGIAGGGSDQARVLAREADRGRGVGGAGRGGGGGEPCAHT